MGRVVLFQQRFAAVDGTVSREEIILPANSRLKAVVVGPTGAVGSRGPVLGRISIVKSGGIGIPLTESMWARGAVGTTVESIFWNGDMPTGTRQEEYAVRATVNNETGANVEMSYTVLVELAR